MATIRKWLGKWKVEIRKKGYPKLHEFMNVMNKNNFTLSKILTAKPFIADLCFQSNDDLQL